MNSNSFGVILLLVLLQSVASAGIMGSKHDLSANNEVYGNLFGEASTQVCVFCHTPHAANSTLTDGNPGQAPIWNRKITDDTQFKLYTGGFSLPVGPTPSPISVACLSCLL